MRKAFIITKGDEESEAIKASLARRLGESGFIINEEEPDIVFTIGGDGTFLRGVHKYKHRLDKVTLLGINKGTLGYLVQFKPEEIDDIFEGLKNDSLQVQNSKLLRAKIDEKEIYAFNEIRIENPFHTLTCRVLIDGEELEVYRGSGLVVSTSTGSSAYNKSLGGAIVDTSLDVMELTEIAPLENNVFRTINSSIVLGEKSKIEFIGDFTHVIVGYDYFNLSLEESEKISIRLSSKQVRFFRSNKRNRVKALRECFIE